MINLLHIGGGRRSTANDYVRARQAFKARFARDPVTATLPNPLTCQVLRKMKREADKQLLHTGTGQIIRSAKHVAQLERLRHRPRRTQPSSTKKENAHG